MVDLGANGFVDDSVVLTSPRGELCKEEEEAESKERGLGSSERSTGKVVLQFLKLVPLPGQEKLSCRGDGSIEKLSLRVVLRGSRGVECMLLRGVAWLLEGSRLESSERAKPAVRPRGGTLVLPLFEGWLRGGREATFSAIKRSDSICVGGFV